MTPQQFEHQVLQICDRVRAGDRVESSYWELKREWPVDIPKVARRIAGHCNAARGGLAAWIIGIDDCGAVHGTNAQEFANWWPQVQSEFEGEAPALIHHCAPRVDDKTVVGLLFDSSTAPYVVRNPLRDTKGAIAREVPWRIGTAVRTATREDLLRILVPIQSVPSLRGVAGRLNIGQQGEALRGEFTGIECWQWWLKLTLFATMEGTAAAVIPYDRCRVELRTPGASEPFCRMRCVADYTKKGNVDASTAVTATLTEFRIPGSGGFVLTCTGVAPVGPSLRNLVLNLQVSLESIGAPFPAVAQLRFSPDVGRDEDPKFPTWTMEES